MSPASSSSHSAKPPCVRHGLSDCAQDVKDALSGKMEFFHRLQRVTVDSQAVDGILQRHCRGVSQPQKSLQDVLPKAKDVTSLQASVAFAYVASPALAQQVNRLMRAQSWAALFSEYGQVLHCLLGYISNVERVYVAKRTLYRGTKMPDQHLRQHYVVGQVVTWGAFASVTTHRGKALSYARESYDRDIFAQDGIPVLFVIETYSRGAVLGEWTPYVADEELLLPPFLCFEVTSVAEAPPEDDPSKQMRVVTMQVVKTPRSCRISITERPLLTQLWNLIRPTPQTEVLSELEEDEEEEMRRKLDPPGSYFLAVLVLFINTMLLIMQFVTFDLDFLSLDHLLS
eukprot:TRINITY_DN35430_c0_g1_i1.p1 TRINITY_DN35430_c0_g1~~TRINITY_DN35430_c0_g1_i1.p1  ORF type:complete len:352 (+),score=55.20 TRINITY_DN35430_c0_g1_i1:31-1056(+)